MATTSAQKRSAGRRSFDRFIRTRYSEQGTRLFYRLIREHAHGRVLDFGAGRGAYKDDPEARALRDLRDQAEVWACDIDPVVLTHSCSDRQIVVEPTALPFPDNHFDMIVSDWVFEHIERPARVCPEIVRVLKPGGLIFARTPRRWGYPAIAARLIPERLHLSVLRWAQPTREPRDVFRAHYRLNTLAAARAYFRGCAVSHYLCGLSPAYFPVGQDLARTLHVLFPHMLATAICFVIEKPTAQ